MARKPPKVPDGSKSKYDPTRRPATSATEILLRHQEAEDRINMEMKMANDRIDPDAFISAMARARAMMMDDSRGSRSGRLNNPFLMPGDFMSMKEDLVGSGDSPTFKHLAAVKQYLHKSATSEDWAAMIGNVEAIDEMRTSIEGAYKHGDIYNFYNMEAPKGILLWGPPGNGKTMLARIAASIIGSLYGKNEGECLIINGPDIQTRYVGQTEEIIRSLFAYASEYAKAFGHPLVIFFDEADSLLPNRNYSYRYEASQVAQMLACMDGVKKSEALVILATNRPEMIDPAILRPGRIDIKIKVDRPRLEDIHEHLVRAHRLNPMRCEESAMKKVADYMVLPKHVVGEFMAGKSDGSEVMKVNVTFAHIISGAICVEIFARAKRICFRRDIRFPMQQPEGIHLENLFEAVDQLVQENLGLPHESAMHEIMEDLNRQEKETKLKRMN